MKQRKNMTRREREYRRAANRALFALAVTGVIVCSTVLAFIKAFALCAW